VAENLLQNQAGRAKFIPLYHAVADVEDAALVATGDMRNVGSPFDVVVLGMGGDGHTASFFPGGNNLEQALKPSTRRGIITMEAQDAGEPRLTFTFSALQDARLLVLHIEGEAKKAVIEKALAEGRASALPVGRVISNASSDTEIYWAP
jgi:6-phosphogluconolactonase